MHQQQGILAHHLGHAGHVIMIGALAVLLQMQVCAQASMTGASMWVQSCRCDSQGLQHPHLTPVKGCQTCLCAMQRRNSIKETRDLQEDFVHKAESQLETFQQTVHSMSDTASQSELNATQISLLDQRLPLKQIPQKAPAPTTRHLRQILRTASKSARQVGL